MKILIGSEVLEVYREWHMWFAWRPVFAITNNGEKIYLCWLRKVKRKIISSYISDEVVGMIVPERTEYEVI